jgi:hypothetical protein
VAAGGHGASAVELRTALALLDAPDSAPPRSAGAPVHVRPPAPVAIHDAASSVLPHLAAAATTVTGCARPAVNRARSRGLTSIATGTANFTGPSADPGLISPKGLVPPERGREPGPSWSHRGRREVTRSTLRARRRGAAGGARAFLRARRASVKPGDVGLPEGTSRRRTPGLSREEIAQLAGAGLAWYTWLEQGRVLATSQQVIDAVARALLLGHEEHAHLCALANLPPPTPADRSGGLAASIRRTIDNLSPNPAYVLDHRIDFLAWNDAYCRVWRDLAAIPRDRRNLIWLFFTDENLRGLVVDREARAAALLAQFHAVVGRNPGDQRLAQLVDELTANSPPFHRWWPGYRVGGLGSARHVIRHPEAGEIRFDLAQRRIDHQPGLTVVLQTPATPVDRDRLVALLG